MTVFDERFTSGQVIKAARITNAMLQTWIKRGVIGGAENSGVDMPGSPGIKRTFSFNNVMEVALAKALIDQGVDVTRSFRAAWAYAYSGTHGRLPALPFPETGRTVLRFNDRWRRVERAGEQIKWGSGEDRYCVEIDAGDVFDRVADALGYHPEEILEQAYETANS